MAMFAGSATVGNPIHSSPITASALDLTGAAEDGLSLLVWTIARLICPSTPQVQLLLKQSSK